MENTIAHTLLREFRRTSGKTTRNIKVGDIVQVHRSSKPNNMATARCEDTGLQQKWYNTARNDQNRHGFTN